MEIPSKGDWPNLKNLILMNMKIGTNGVSFILTSNWTNLKSLNLCNNILKHRWK
jgi:hypothetical protein